jgi:class 3 adenylate cyclase/tetratricopeptide (TPR) repeat protein
MAPDAASQEVRKTVTVVFADVAGSTELGERLDPEAVRRIMIRYFEEMRGVVERHDGTVEKFIGDAIMAVFGIPRVHEDDALRAVRAAAEMRDRLAALNAELEQEWDVRLEMRIGVNTGEVVAGDPQSSPSLAVGDTVNVTARLEQAAEPGEILVGEATYRLVRDAVEFDQPEELRLKGKAGLFEARRLQTVRPRVAGAARRLDRPMIGRREELALLEREYERAVREGACRLVTVIGPAGIGKSRLLREFVSLLPAEALVSQGRCLPYGEGITYWPVTEAVKDLAGVGDDDSAAEVSARLIDRLSGEGDARLVASKVAAAAGLGTGEVAKEEASWAFRRLLEALARERPLVVVFDDIQWGEETFLDLLEYVVERSDAGVLVVCLARPELLDLRPGWGDGKRKAATVVLEPLRGEECTLLVQKLLGDGELDEQARASLIERAGGNPFFVEEMVGMLFDEGLLERVNGHWSFAGELDKLALPGSIQALLAARLDRLPLVERRVLERGAVEGEVFHREPLVVLHGEPDLDVALESLVRKQLLRPVRGAFPGGDAYRFGHLLIRDAAYSTVPKEVRADLHRRFADWLERAAGDRSVEQEEILGYHLEQACRYHAELGRRMDEDVVATAARAARLLESAGGRAARRGDMPAATKLLERAANLVPDGDEHVLEIELVLGWALTQLGEFAAAEMLFAQVVERAAASGDRRLELRARIELMDVVNIVRPDGAVAAMFRLADEVVPELEALGDDRGLARAWRMRAYAQNTLARYGATAEALEQGLVHADRAGDAVIRSEILAWLPTRLARGPVPTEQALERCRELLARAAGDLPAEAGALAGIALLEAMSGRFDEAREAERRSREIKEELGLAFTLAVGYIWRGELELYAGNPHAAESAFAAAAAFLLERGDRNFYPTAAAGLARSRFQQGRYDESDEALRSAEETTASDDSITVVWTLGTRARHLAREERLHEAEAAARRGVELASQTDDLNLQAESLIELADVLREPLQARAALERAFAVAESKGNVVFARQASERLATPRTGGAV